MLLKLLAIANHSTMRTTMATIAAASMFAASSEQGVSRTIIDFSLPSTATDWVAVDDRIMGGASTSRVVHEDGATLFEGTLVVEGGGFASVRYAKDISLRSDVDALALEARSDGRMGYKVTLQSGAAQQGVSYQYVLPPLEAGGAFETLRLPLADFKPTFRGRAAPGAPPLKAADVCGLGLMLSRYENTGGVKEAIPPGKFAIRLRRLEEAESELAINGRRWVRGPG